MKVRSNSRGGVGRISTVGDDVRAHRQSTLRLALLPWCVPSALRPNRWNRGAPSLTARSPALSWISVCCGASRGVSEFQELENVRDGAVLQPARAPRPGKLSMRRLLWRRHGAPRSPGIQAL